ncbi:MAG: pilus assembly protein N-terminal domain-containing protein [Methylocystis sp.]
MKSSSSLYKGLLRLGCVLIMLLGGANVASSAGEKAIRVELDYARVVKIPHGAQTLVIGNPLIADVTMLRNNQLMVITGKSFGTTNLIVLDVTGAQVGESTITVVHPNDKLVVYRGPHRESYSCTPNCMAAVDLGDDHAYMGETIGAIKLHEGTLTIGKH